MNDQVPTRQTAPHRATERLEGFAGNGHGLLGSVQFHKRRHEAQQHGVVSALVGAWSHGIDDSRDKHFELRTALDGAQSAHNVHREVQGAAELNLHI